MPHLIVEYTDNLRGQTDIPKLLRTCNAVLMKHPDVFPVGGLRSRAIELHDYCIADGKADDAFVHITLKIGSGRTEEEIRIPCDELFDAVKAHFADLFKQRYLALSMELYEFARPTWKQNNIHKRFK